MFVEYLENPIILNGVVAVARAVLGYAENCAELGKFEKFDFKKLLATIFRVGTMSFALGMLGAPAGSAIPFDMGLSALKKAGATVAKK